MSKLQKASKLKHTQLKSGITEAEQLEKRRPIQEIPVCKKRDAKEPKKKIKKTVNLKMPSCRGNKELNKKGSSQEKVISLKGLTKKFYFAMNSTKTSH